MGSFPAPRLPMLGLAFFLIAGIALTLNRTPAPAEYWCVSGWPSEVTDYPRIYGHSNSAFGGRDVSIARLNKPVGPYQWVDADTERVFAGATPRRQRVNYCHHETLPAGASVAIYEDDNQLLARPLTPQLEQRLTDVFGPGTPVGGATYQRTLGFSLLGLTYAGAVFALAAALSEPKLVALHLRRNTACLAIALWVAIGVVAFIHLGDITESVPRFTQPVS